MKELIFHRHFLPTVERWPDKVGFHDGDYQPRSSSTPTVCCAWPTACVANWAWCPAIASP